MPIVFRISGTKLCFLSPYTYPRRHTDRHTDRQTDRQTYIYIYIYIYINEMNENFQNTLANLLVVDQLQLEHASHQRLGHIISNSDNMKLAKQSESLRYVVFMFHLLLLGRAKSVRRSNDKF